MRPSPIPTARELSRRSPSRSPTRRPATACPSRGAAGRDQQLDQYVRSGRHHDVLAGTAPQADYETAIKQVRFSNSSDNPDTTVRDITVVASDGDGDGPTAHALITVTAVNDAPVLVGVAAAGWLPPAAGPKTLAPGRAHQRRRQRDAASATVHVSGGFAADGDVLAVSAAGLAGTNIVASYNAATETLTLSAPTRWRITPRCSSTSRSATRPPTSGAIGAQTIEWQVNDGAASEQSERLRPPRSACRAAGERLQRQRPQRHPVAEHRRHAGGLADGRHQRCRSARRSDTSVLNPAAARPGMRSAPAISTATASPTSCGRTPTAPSPSG